MKNILLRKNLSGIIFLYMICVLISCNDPDIIGLEVQPVNDKFNLFYNDSCRVIAFTLNEDSIRTDKTSLNLLGNYNDPIFGRSSASIYTQVRISSNNVDFGPSPVVDSLVLTLAYNGYYGKLRKLNIKVFEILEDFYKDTAYYSNKVLNTDNTPLANLSVVPEPADSLTINGEKLAPHLRIKLSNTLAQKFLNESTTANLSDNYHFTQFFKGIYITSSFVNTEGAILYFDLLSALSQMTLYYKNDNNDSLKFDFVINDYCARFNSFNHFNYNDAVPALKQQIGGDTILGDSLLYLQAMSGLKVKIILPDYKNFFADGKTVLNKAELIIPVEDDPTVTNYSLPPKLALVRITEEGEIAYIIDQYEGESHFRGIYDEDKKQYTFTITRHLQNVLLDKIKDNGFYLMVSGAGVNAGRACLKGTQRNDAKLKLKLTYTKL